MILMRYSKTLGVEYIAHLDLMRSIGRTLSRAKIKVNYSQGFHPHMLLYMSAPLGLGIKSYSEYCLIDTDESVEGFKDKFNAVSQKGLKCVGAWYTPKKIGVASDIVKAKYLIKGINSFDEKEILSSDEFIILDKNGNEKNVRNLIYEIEITDDGVVCVLGFGNGLRVEKFAEKLTSRYGGEAEIIKEEGLLFGGRPFESVIEGENQCP